MPQGVVQEFQLGDGITIYVAPVLHPLSAPLLWASLKALSFSICLFITLRIFAYSRGFSFFLSNIYAQRGAQSHDPEINSHMLYQPESARHPMALVFILQ